MDNGFGDFSPIFVFAAYAIVWIAFFSYLYYVARGQAAIRSEIEALKDAASDDAHNAEGGTSP